MDSNRQLDADAAREAADLAAKVRDAALARGFSRVGFCPVEPFARGAEALRDWLAAGRHGDLAYMAQHPGRAEPRSLLESARSLVVVALAYPKQPEAPATDDPRPRGRIARYARGQDYHTVFKDELYDLADDMSVILGRPVLSRPCVDTAPILEREAAHRAGVGFIAKSNMCIVPGLGTYVMLGELLVDVDLAPGAEATSKCGSCRRCLDACPTGAFVDAFVLDARRCISYLTIELEGPMPRELRPLIGTWVFGCDVCQEVCPFNASPQEQRTAPELAPRQALAAPVLEELLLLGSAGYRKLVKRTALRRVGRAQLARNAAVALGNVADPRTIPSLARALRSMPPLVRGHAAWALGRIGDEAARAALDEALHDESDAWVREEIELALATRGRDQRSSSSATTGT